MATIHDEIDNYLAADLHDELSEEERSALHMHLVECATCRRAHQENKIMNKILEEKFAAEKPDTAFEQRMLAGFRNRIPQRGAGVAKFIVDLLRLRSAQITAVAAVLLALVQVGRMITGEGATSPRHRKTFELAQAPVTRDQEYETRSAEYKAALAELENLNKQVDAPALSSDAKKEKINERDEKIADVKNRERELQAFASAKVAPTKMPQGGSAPEDASPTNERTIVAGLNIPTAEEVGQNPADTYRRDEVTRLGVRAPTDRIQRIPSAQGSTAPETGNEPLAVMAAPASKTSPTVPAALANRKLIRNASVDLEIVSFDDAVQKITAFTNEERGYVATTSSEKQENGKLKGEIVVKVLPENLDRFLQKIRRLGELKNQTLGTEDITKAYFDSESRLKNARVMEQRLIDMLKKKSDDINDLLQVEKELGRVREEIEKMQGDLKFWDSQVQFATVTISLAEKDMEEAAKFLLKERAQLALYSPEVEKVYNDIKALASLKVQITNAQLDRDSSGRVSARISMLIVPEESDGVIGKVKAMGRVENFQMQTERVAQGGEGMSENAKTKRDKVELNITISRDEQEQAFQQTNLRIRTSSVDEKAKGLRSLAEKQSGRVRSSSFSRDPDGREFANVTLRVPMKNYSALMQSLDSLGKVENVSVQRQDRTGAQIDEANAPADLSIQVYSQGNIVSSNAGLFATLRRTIAQSAAAIMWSLRMIGVAIAFLAPWVMALVAVIWVTRRIVRARRQK
ncbi:MAG TPA: DUF4349 domain-containing protein [Chthoniobacterales bacterium]|nr:DUF4349 domain-containing protein [Chthoniobacterales bacterium]